MDYPFCHLHVHSEYSLLDGSAKIKEIISRTKELGMDSIAITDHGVMYGVIDFYKEAVAQGIKPILGCEVYVATGSRYEKQGSSEGNYYHLVLLAENETGYQNLIQLVSAGFTEGFYYKPRVDLELLEQHKEGLIALSACLAGPVARTILNNSYENAVAVAKQYDEIFGRNNFFLELQDHGMQEQKKVNEALLRMSEETGIPLVCTNDSHYIYEKDAQAHDVLLCIQTGKTVQDEARLRYEGSSFYIKSPEEMHTLFSYCPEALENTAKIAGRCHVEITFHELRLPQFDCPEGKTPLAYLKELCVQGLHDRYQDITSEMQERLDYEIATIDAMGYVDYFLIVWDFIRYARDNHIRVGPGRGSAAGSIVSYCLYITNIDPLEFNLLFERFLNPERISMPDIDIDFCYERRQEVIDYVTEKYGATHVAQIITFGTLAARARVKDVGRALGMPYAEVDKVSKMIPFELGITLERALSINKELQDLYQNDESVTELVDMAKRLEGLPRHASTHAAGVLICKDPVTDYVPLNVGSDGTVTTQFTMTALEELGLLKMDFLGLRTLTIINNATDEIKRCYGKEIDIDRDTKGFDDPKVYELLSQADTEGIFQLESSGMKSFLKELKPSGLSDIIAGVALYRPGPMEFIPKYVRGKHTQGAISYTHPALEPILKDTYGCIVYQEQVMQIVRDLAGYSLGRSDLVRRAMSKKKTDVMLQEKKVFIEGNGEDVPGCINNGIQKDVAEKIFDEMVDFAKYAFNKSHAAAYAVLAYQTAWLKVYYPLPFMAATLTSVTDFSGKVTEYIEDCKQMNIPLQPPDINESFASFAVSGEAVQFGLAAVKNVGRGAVSAIVAEREENGPFQSLSEFINRMGSNILNRRMLESLISAGAFDCFGGKRAQYLAVYRPILDDAATHKKKTMEGQMSLFDFGDSPVYEDTLPEVPELPISQILNREKEVLGFYVSGHPLDSYKEQLDQIITARSSEIFRSDLEGEALYQWDGKKVVMGGLISAISTRVSRNGGRLMSFVTIEDLNGFFEVLVFPDIHEKNAHLFVKEQIIVVEGHVSISADGDTKLIASNFSRLEEHGRKKECLGIVIPKEKLIAYSDICSILSQYAGDSPVYIHDVAQGKKYKANRSHWVSLSEELLKGLSSLLGEANIIVKEDKAKG